MHAALAEQVRHPVDHPAGHLLARGRLGRPGQQVVERGLERPADQRVLVLLCPRAAHLGHDRALDLEPQRLGVDEQAVHVEQHGLQRGASDGGRPEGGGAGHGLDLTGQEAGAGGGGAGQVLKYLASG